MPDQVPDEVKRERIERLVDVVQTVAAARNETRVGLVEEVLVEGREPHRPEPPARPDAPQHDRELLRHAQTPGDLVDVTIERATSTTLAGSQLAVAVV